MCFREMIFTVSRMTCGIVFSVLLLGCSEMASTDDRFDGVFENSNLDGLAALIDQCGVDCKDKHGATLLHRAVYEKNEAMVGYLLNEGASVDLKDDYFNNPPIYHAVSAQDSLFKLLLDANADPNLSGKKGVTALMRAAYKKELSKLDQLIQHGANVNQMDDKGETALFYAADSGELEVLAFLIQKAGANPSAVNAKGESVLSRMISNEKPDLLQQYCKGVGRKTEKQLLVDLIDQLKDRQQSSGFLILLEDCLSA